MVTRVEEALAWGESVDKLLQCKKGQMVFGEFLKTEYSEENILFWLACEQYKKVPSISEMRSTANRIYSEFVQVDAPRQGFVRQGAAVNLPADGEGLLPPFPQVGHLPDSSEAVGAEMKTPTGAPAGGTLLVCGPSRLPSPIRDTQAEKQYTLMGLKCIK
ncbi:regulator of G-protein signaling 3-like isoform X1 [Hypomesus transpacificus]|uniref:regulator of G-protein signaling 3-like isoform X1 n=1 Tax=Hypomesus transpacificus TaxID=137520 RepID=UPI001F087183|nr:regulator of G-protein signaling 3-like isoform X1 [Hypomesus transpacificus]